MTAAIRALAADTLFQTALVLIALDFILGVAAAFKPPSTFSLAYVSDFLHRDVLGKVLPWGAVYIAAHLSNADVLGVSLDDVATGLWAFVALGLGGSIASSLDDLGLPIPAFAGRGEVPPPGP